MASLGFAALGPAGLALISFIGAIISLTSVFALTQLRRRLAGLGDCDRGRHS